MDGISVYFKLCLGLLFITPIPLSVQADPPDLQTPEPVIYLSDNLDEKDHLGWCIDTVGRGFSENLHAHSCKPQGGDVQFSYNETTRQIVSATYTGKCATLLAPAADGVALGLVDCSPASPLQVFTYLKETAEFRPAGDDSYCLVVGTTSKPAGPYMSRTLQLAPCESTEAKYKQWQIRGGENAAE